ncbi:MAG TPA: ABC transporter permease [Streptosporangiaceae bacterium]|jgi:ABC-2 type transport system permease protein
MAEALAAPADAADRLPGLLPVLAGQVRYQLLILMRTPRALIASLILPGALLALRLGRVSHAARGSAGALSLTAVVAGLVVFGLLGTAYMTHASGLVAAREDGVLRRWRAAPLPAGGYFTGRMTATVLLTDASAMILVLIGITMASLHVTGMMTVSILVNATIGALVFAGIGTAVTIVVSTAQAANPVLMITYLPLVILSGALGSTAGFPHWLVTVMDYLPARPLIETMTRVLQQAGQGLVVVSGRDLAVLLAWGLAGVAVSVAFFRWDPHRPAHASRPAGHQDGAAQG